MSSMKILLKIIFYTLLTLYSKLKALKCLKEIYFQIQYFKIFFENFKWFNNTNNFQSEPFKKILLSLINLFIYNKPGCENKKAQYI